MQKINLTLNGVGVEITPPPVDAKGGAAGLSPDQWAQLLSGILALILQVFFPHAQPAPSPTSPVKK